MLIPVRRVLWLWSLSCLPHYAMAASDAPKGYLKGIKIISYDLGVEKTVGGDDCKIDQGNLNTSIEFVANQSTKLKIVSSDQIMKHSNELMGSPAFHEYNYMPIFYIGIQPLQTTQFTCAATINARLSEFIDVENAHIIPTQALISYPAAEIWETSIGFVGPQQTFSNQVINATERAMKELVNDWAAAQ